MSSEVSKVTKKSRTNRTSCTRPSADSICDSCRNANEPCRIDISKRRQKPFYFVSEEEYRLLHQLCKQTFPDQDLSVDNLRRLASGDVINTPPQSVEACHSTPSIPPKDIDTVDPAGARPPDPDTYQEDVALPEIVNLHQDLGCLMADAQGEYRYMGPESGVGFNRAVTAWVLNPMSRPGNNRDIIESMVKVKMPSGKLHSRPGAPPTDPTRLPPREIIMACSSRYFEEVHSMYWLYTSEDFHTRLEAMCSGTQAPQTDSWYCSIHSIIALGALCIPDPELARSSLEVAKQLVPRVCDEADLDSIRALIMLSQALQCNGYMNTAYLNIGLAVRIALSLGLHIDKYSANGSVVANSYARRLWWSLFLFDQDLALQLGKPCMSGTSDFCPWQPPLPSEQIVNPGSYTPHEYLKHCISLANLTKQMRHNLYAGPIHEGRRLSQSKFDDSLKSLKRWQEGVPQHLNITSFLQPLHRRPVAILHLRYWNSVMLITRPFLFCNLMRRNELVDPAKKKFFDRLSDICVSGALASLEIFEDMVYHGVVSSLILLDFFYALQVQQILLMASTVYSAEQYLGPAKRCIRVLMAIARYGCSKHLLPETFFQLQKYGLLNDEERESISASLEPRYEMQAANRGEMEQSTRPSEEQPMSRPMTDDLDFFDFSLDQDFLEQLMDISGPFSTSPLSM